MKTVTVTIPDDLYQNAEQLAAKQGATLTQQIVEWIKQFVPTEKPAARAMALADANSTPDVTRLLGCLDRANNVTPIGRLRREELYDRDIAR
jgi:thioredoxin-like negative regulator of GroEL